MVKNIIREVVEMIIECSPKIEVEIVSDDTNLMDDLEYDSLSIIDLFEEINMKYNIDCYDNPNIYDALESVSSLSFFISKLICESECKNET